MKREPGYLVFLILLFQAWTAFASTGSQVCKVENPGNPPKKTQKKIKVNFAIVDIRSIDTHENSFYVDFYLRMTWRDPDLRQLNSQGKCDEGGELSDINEIWTPKIEFANDISVVKKTPEGFQEYKLIKDNIIILDRRYAGTFSSIMDFKKFPFDVQTLKISMEDYDMEREDLVLIYAEQDPDAPPVCNKNPLKVALSRAFEGSQYASSEWRINSVFVCEENKAYEYFKHSENFTETQYSRFTIGIAMSRSPVFYNLKLVLPTILIVMISWVVFLISPGDLSGRSSISVTSLLALVAQTYIANQVLPEIPYMTALDRLVMGNQILVFLTVVVNIIEFVVGRKHFAVDPTGGPTVKAICTVSLVGFPVLTVLLLIQYVSGAEVY